MGLKKKIIVAAALLCFIALAATLFFTWTIGSERKIFLKASSPSMAVGILASFYIQEHPNSTNFNLSRCDELTLQAQKCEREDLEASSPEAEYCWKTTEKESFCYYINSCWSEAEKCRNEAINAFCGSSAGDWVKCIQEHSETREISEWCTTMNEKLLALGKLSGSNEFLLGLAALGDYTLPLTGIYCPSIDLVGANNAMWEYANSSNNCFNALEAHYWNPRKVFSGLFNEIKVGNSTSSLKNVKWSAGELDLAEVAKEAGLDGKEVKILCTSVGCEETNVLGMGRQRILRVEGTKVIAVIGYGSGARVCASNGKIYAIIRDKSLATNEEKSVCGLG